MTPLLPRLRNLGFVGGLAVGAAFLLSPQSAHANEWIIEITGVSTASTTFSGVPVISGLTSVNHSFRYSDSAHTTLSSGNPVNFSSYLIPGVPTAYSIGEVGAPDFVSGSYSASLKVDIYDNQFEPGIGVVDLAALFLNESGNEVVVIYYAPASSITGTALSNLSLLLGAGDYLSQSFVRTTASPDQFTSSISGLSSNPVIPEPASVGIIAGLVALLGTGWRRFKRT